MNIENCVFNTKNVNKNKYIIKIYNKKYTICFPKKWMVYIVNNLMNKRNIFCSDPTIFQIKKIIYLMNKKVEINEYYIINMKYECRFCKCKSYKIITRKCLKCNEIITHYTDGKEILDEYCILCRLDTIFITSQIKLNYNCK